MVKLRLANWNVITVDNENRRNKIVEELTKYNIDIACLQETKLCAHKFSPEGFNYTFFSPGTVKVKCQYSGVGFACKNELLKLFISYFIVNPERLIAYQLILDNESIHIINVYAPTDVRESEDKDKFYDCLEEAISKIPESETVLIIGDFNAQVGADNVAWPTCLGPYGVGKINDNGQRLLEFCSIHELCVLNTYTELPESEQYTHRNPKWKTWSQLDLCITRSRDRHKVLTTRPVINLRDTFDHKMVFLEIDTQLTVPSITLNSGNIQMLKVIRYLLQSVQYVIKTKKSLPVEDSFVCETSDALTEAIFLDDIFEDQSNFIEQLKDIINKIEKSFFNEGCDLADEAIQDILNAILQVSKLFLKETIAIEKNEFETLFGEVKRFLIEPPEFTLNETAYILKGKLSEADKAEIIKVVHEFSINNKLEHNDKAILQNETIECCQDFVLPREFLYLFICQHCMNIFNLPTTFPSKDFSSTLRNLLTKCMLTRLKSLVTDDMLQQYHIFKCPDERDMLFALNLLQEKCLEKVVPFYVAFVDLSQILTSGKTPTSVNRLMDEAQWALYLPLLVGNASGDDSQIQKELTKHLLSYILVKSIDDCNGTLTLKFDFDGDLFDRSRLKLKSTKDYHLNAIQYGCYAAIFATKKREIQKSLVKLENICNAFGLSFIQNKPSLLAQNVKETPRKLKFGLDEFCTSKNATFLGIHFLGDKFSLETEIFKRINNACKRLQSISCRVPENINLYINNILPGIMRHLEVLSLTDEQEDALVKFHESTFRRFKVKPEPYGMSQQIRLARMLLLGFYHRNDSDSITKRILYGDLDVARKSVSYLNNLRKDFKRLDIKVEHWKVLAKNEKVWENEIKTKL